MCGAEQSVGCTVTLTASSVKLVTPFIDVLLGF